MDNKLTDDEIKRLVYELKDATTAMCVGTHEEWYASCRDVFERLLPEMGLKIVRLQQVSAEQSGLELLNDTDIDEWFDAVECPVCHGMGIVEVIK